MSYRRNALAFTFLVLASCGPVDVGAIRAPIIGGARETGQPSVVAILIMLPSGSGALCSGSVIGPHAVMTAKHCVFDETTGAMLAPDSFYVVPQDDVTSGVSSVAYVAEVRTTPGSDIDAALVNGDDIAILLTSTRISQPALGTAVGTTVATGDVVTIVGYGRTRTGTPDPMDSGLKYTTTVAVSGIGSHRIETDGPSSTCQGDSGGPLFDTAGNVAGITSYGVDGRCVDPRSYFTRVSRHAALIADALAWSPACMPVAEICNGSDDNCDGVVDEGCLGIGEACTTDAQCPSGSCANIDGAMVCTRPCNPAAFIPACPVDTYCSETGCGVGQCRLGGPGGVADGVTCAADGDCGSLHCGTVAGARMCGKACNTAPGSAGCPSGEVCDTTGGTAGCGSCVPFAMSDAPRPFGSACTLNTDCASGMCGNIGMPEAFCTASCSVAADCGTGFHCRAGTCVLGDLGGPGTACVSAMDCAGTAPDCVAIEGDPTCSPSCAGGAMCPDGFVCAAVDDGSMHCAHPGAGLGTACTLGSECRSGLCLTGACLRFCTSSSPCPTGFDCVATSDPTLRVCVRAAPPTMTSRGGCSVSAGTRAGGAGALALVLAGLVLVTRRRRR